MGEYFLSHAGADKPIVRNLGVQLQLVGADLFFDEWSIDFGESITGAIEAAIGTFDVFVLVWSADAERSLWTRREYRSAIKKVIEDPDRRFILLKLDETPVPDLVSDLKYLDFSDEDVGAAVDGIMGLKGPAERVKAIQAFLEESGIEVEYIPGYGPIVGCPVAVQAWTRSRGGRKLTTSGTIHTPVLAASDVDGTTGERSETWHLTGQRLGRLLDCGGRRRSLSRTLAAV